MVDYVADGYRLWDPKEHIIVIGRDVRFDESSFNYQRSKERKEETEKPK